MTKIHKKTDNHQQRADIVFIPYPLKSYNGFRTMSGQPGHHLYRRCSRLHKYKVTERIPAKERKTLGAPINGCSLIDRFSLCMYPDSFRKRDADLFDDIPHHHYHFPAMHNRIDQDNPLKKHEKGGTETASSFDKGYYYAFTACTY